MKSFLESKYKNKNYINKVISNAFRNAEKGNLLLLSKEIKEIKGNVSNPYFIQLKEVLLKSAIDSKINHFLNYNKIKLPLLDLHKKLYEVELELNQLRTQGIITNFDYENLKATFSNLVSINIYF